MEKSLSEQQRQDWSMFEYSGQLVCRDVEGWQVRRLRALRQAGYLPACLAILLPVAAGVGV